MRSLLAAYKAFAGHKEEALAQLRELLRLAEERYISPVHLSQVYFGLGDFDTMFDLMEKGLREGDHTLRGFLRLQSFDVLRSHPRFQDLQRRLGIAP